MLSQASSQTVPHVSSMHISTRPSKRSDPPTNLTSPVLHAAIGIHSISIITNSESKAQAHSMYSSMVFISHTHSAPDIDRIDGHTDGQYMRLDGCMARGTPTRFSLNYSRVGTQVTPTSSLCTQLCVVEAAQSTRRLSVPLQATSSRNMSPRPAPKKAASRGTAPNLE